MSDRADELPSLYAAARAYLEWEEQLSGFGIPALALERAGAAEVASAAVQAAPAGTRSASGSGSVPSSSPSAVRGSLSAPPVPPFAHGSAHPTGAVAQSGSEQAAPRATLAALSARPAVEMDAGERRVRLQQLEEEVRGCSRCELAKGRTQTVFARGNPESPLVFIGEGPGQEEDRQGLPFVGPAGQLLDRMVTAMGFGRDDVYICNVVKCRPPGNRTPLPSEAGACAPFLLAQLELVRPHVIVALGRCAAENMGLVAGGSWRGRWGKFQGVDVMPTYHPAFLLRSPEFKRPVWEDLQKVMSRLKESV